MRNTLTMKQPSAFFGQPWREATPIGNGLTGALVYGGTASEHVLFNRFDCWHNANICEIPDVSEKFAEMRKLMDNDDYFGARDTVCNELRSKGYNPDDGTPFPLGILRLDTEADGLFKNYKRKLRMDKAESEITYDEKSGSVKRSAFISRADDVFAMHISSDAAKEYKISLAFHNDNTAVTNATFEKIKDSFVTECKDEFYCLKAVNDGICYGIALYVPEGVVKNGELYIESKDFCVFAKCFSGKTELDFECMKKALADCGCNYEELLEKHLPLHKALYESCDIDISEATDKTNEALIDEAYENEASAELIEKMWRFGRYLFVCGTHKDGLPFPLYGLWAGEYRAAWAQYVCNENVQISYWQALTGNLAELMKPLIKFFCANMDVYKDAARKLFGCNGIFVSVYSSPLNAEPYPVVPVIIHYLSCAGWLCSHFYNYYKATGDKEYLEKYIIPFMVESARFYLDYAKYGKDGKMMLYPSVSPENSPENFMNDDRSKHMAHQMPTARNAAMDFGILKELLTNLVSLSDEGYFDEASAGKWKNALDAIPPYMVNESGAVCEWMDKRFEDNYLHRHLSHIYPLFPGNEITKKDSLYGAFKKAVDMRILGAQSGWSLAHMSGIYCAMGEGERALECLDILSKSCLLDNFFTLHNDYRYTGLTLDMGYLAPVQLDAILGSVNAVQMMLFGFDGDTVQFLPALPARLAKGKVKGFAFNLGKADFEWSTEEKHFAAEIRIERDGETEIILPEGFGKLENFLDGKSVKAGRISVKAGNIITIR